MGGEINHQGLTRRRLSDASFTMMVLASQFAVWGQKHGAGMAPARALVGAIFAAGACMSAAQTADDVAALNKQAVQLYRQG